MWADTIFRAEQAHLLRVLLWAALSIVAATLIVVMLAVRRAHSPLLRQFAMQTAIWGVVFAAIAAVRFNTLPMRDVAGAARLDRMIWFNVGLDVGFVAAGVVLAACAWTLAKRLGPLGAGLGIVVQGLALLVIDLQFAAAVSR